MKVITLEDHRVELTEPEAAQLFQVPNGFRLHEAKVYTHGQQTLLAIVWKKSGTWKHTSIVLLMEPKNGEKTLHG